MRGGREKDRGDREREKGCGREREEGEWSEIGRDRKKRGRE